MNKRIWLATGLILLGTLGVLAFQAYWARQTYQQAQTQLRRDGQAALLAARDSALAGQRNQLIRRYQTWLRDTSRVRISCFINSDSLTQFRLTAYRHGRPVRPQDQFDIGFEDFRPRLNHLTPAAREFFIRRFTQGPLRRNLEQGFTYFYLQQLGRQLDSALRQSRTSQATMRRLFGAELARRGWPAVRFRVQLHDSASGSTPAAGFPLALLPLPLGLHQASTQTLRAGLPAAPRLVLRRLRGPLLASGLLMALVLGCFGYAVSTMRRQKRLADLKDDFTHNMTHELKTPVATIQLAAESLGRFALDAATTREYAGLIAAQAGRLGGLIDQILRSVALEQNALPLAHQPLDWSALVTRVAREITPQFVRAGCCLNGPAPTAPVLVAGNETHLAALLTTLLDNALRYGGPATTLSLETTPAAVRLHLHDNGPGIPAAYRALVFEKFFRVPTGDTHAVKGYGLGLHYARQVARQHGGTLTLAAGPGTTFTLTLPRLSA